MASPRFPGLMDRSAEVLSRRQAGLAECYDWRRTTVGIFDHEVVAALAAGRGLYLRHLCALPRLLPLLYRVQLELWLRERCVVDGTLTAEQVGRRPGQHPGTPIPELYEDYRTWCFGSGRFEGDPPYQEAVPYGCFSRTIRGLAGHARRVRQSTPAGEPVQLWTLVGVTLRA